MGDTRCQAGKTPSADGGSEKVNDNLRRAAVAIDPPPRGALGIRDLLALLETEVGHGFPDHSDAPRTDERPAAPPVRNTG